MSEPGEPRETELKLRIPPESLPRLMQHRLLRRFGNGQVVRPRRLVSTYYDTPDFRLMQARVALRVRKDGKRRIQTVKCAPTVEDGVNVRREWEREVGTGRPVVKGLGDKQLRKLLGAGRVRDRLAPQFVTDFERSTFPLKLRGASVELAVDVGEIKANDRTVPICEAEFELKSGSLSGVYKIARELHKTIGFTLEPLSKAERGFALVTQTPPKPRRAEKLKLNKDCTIAEAFIYIGRSCLMHLRANEPAVRGGGSAEGVHQFRVAIRRLRSALTAFRAILPASQRQQTSRDLRWIAHQLGNARAWDVFLSEVLAAVRGQLGADQSLAAFTEAARSARADAYAAVMKTVDSARYTETLLRLEASWEGGAWLAALGEKRDEPAYDFARRALKKLQRRLNKLGDRIAELDEQELHELRIRAKKLRYAAEFFRSLFPARGTKSFIKAMSEVQDRLGSLNDGAMVRHRLAELEKRGDGVDPALFTRASGVITGWNAACVASDLKRLPEAWNRFADERPFWK
jgi:inorganic triphosphatase YgiF